MHTNIVCIRICLILTYKDRLISTFLAISAGQLNRISWVCNFCNIILTCPDSEEKSRIEGFY